MYKDKYKGLFLLFLVILFSTCIKLKNEMMVSTGEITSITTNTADASGSVIDLGEGSITDHGHCYGESPNVSVNNTKTSLGVPSGKGGFTSQLTNLNAGTKYYIKAYITDGKEVVYGKEISFSTQQALLPSVTTSSVSDITQKSASGGGNISSDGGAPVTARGICWNTLPGPTTENFKTSDGTGTGSFSSNLTSLSASTTYYVRAYATNSTGTGYGDEVSFITADAPVAPPVTTTEVTVITSNSATSGGTIRNDGGAPVTGRGVCWSTSSDPTIADFMTSDGTGIGSFVSNLTGLSSGVTYHIRAYAINNVGTSYGNELTFTTEPGLADLTTAEVLSITGISAKSGGNIVSDGGATITARGVCWSNTANPTVSDNKTVNGVGTGSFTSSITGLSPVTIYYVRAYATNSVGTAYGNEQNFTTSQWIPSLTTNAIINYTAESAESGGNITSDGGAEVTGRGVCWNTSGNPTTADSKTNDGSGTGNFTSSITGLNPGTLYYVRSYAINTQGTAYGNELSFTTAATTPSLTTVTVSFISGTGAVSGGNITSDGGSEVTERGVCWGISQNPTISGNHTSDGSGTGIFSSDITGLVSTTKYYVRAYATNNVGTAYGNELSFTTISENPPSTPTNLNADPGDKQITIYWNNATYASDYTLYWSTNPGVSKTNYTGKIENIDTTFYIHSGLTSGTTYYYVVTAKNFYGESTESLEARGTPPLLLQKGTMSTTGEKDYYQITVPAGQCLSVNINIDNSIQNYYLYIKYGSIPTTSDFDEKSETGDDEAVCIPVTQEGIYYIMVYAQYYYWTVSGDYTITGSTGLAALTLGSSFIRTISHQGEKHYYEVTMSEGQNLVVNVNSANSIQNYYLYVRKGSLPTTTIYDASSETGEGEAVSITNTQAGKYYIMVYAFYYYWTVSGDYTISTFP